jgi:Na+-transporting NADH:ubiquinone oxidoreductase subunit NqrC
MNPKTRERIWTVVFMFLCTAVCIACIAALQLGTADIVARNKTLFLKQAVAQAAGRPAFAGAADLQAWYAASVREWPTNGSPQVFRIVGTNGTTAGYAYLQDGAGLWGTIRAAVGLDASNRALTGVCFYENNETPGLGAKITEPVFWGQFGGKAGPFGLKGLTGETPGSRTEMDGITGATITSRAARDILNRVLAEAPARAAAMSGAEGARAP